MYFRFKMSMIYISKVNRVRFFVYFQDVTFVLE